ncbi:hypothetical protein [Actinocrispum wychmicini]|uniref:LPXTG-motif cell wall-anchored protein n=1 Tax=Actinocrispum wychmicini TaxID=1213861 RepID=A0A4R2K1E2_9PSEU|nr:hypothetical protein [Actinocrispum wychmicini]TCO65517.1 hypothetical protein EV192_1011309 [Actinocrispum wychmicini]
MRNRVAGRRTRSLVKKMMAVAGLMLVVTAHAAAAAQNGGIDSNMSTTIAGPVGITAAALGMIGLLLGLWRFVRKSAKARLAARIQAVEPQQPAPVGASQGA